MEQLWAFMDPDVIEDSMDAGGEACALFADVHKAYDQVWRDGLYLGLYANGVRGSMWVIIQKLLDQTEAPAKWNGIIGPMVHQEQGLRQGCVMSPILYCCFVNMLL